MSEATRALAATPGQTIGPFFHYALPYERDHELVPPASPGAIRLLGTVYDGEGTPVPDAMLEIRQADPSGTIPELEGSLQRDGTVFTGWGRADTNSAGRYSFTTVEPGPVPPSGAAFFSVAVFAAWGLFPRGRGDSFGGRCSRSCCATRQGLSPTRCRSATSLRTPQRGSVPTLCSPG
jgi:hypothetical protein